VLVEAPHCLALQSYLILHSSQSNLILSMCKMLALPWHSSMWPGYEAKTLGSDNVHRSGPNVNVSCSLTLQTWQPIETENPLTDMTKFIFILILWLLNMNYTQVWIWLFCKHQWINLDMKPDYGRAKQDWIRAFLNINCVELYVIYAWPHRCCFSPNCIILGMLVIMYFVSSEFKLIIFSPQKETIWRI